MVYPIFNILLLCMILFDPSDVKGDLEETDICKKIVYLGLKCYQGLTGLQECGSSATACSVSVPGEQRCAPLAPYEGCRDLEDGSLTCFCTTEG